MVHQTPELRDSLPATRDPSPETTRITATVDGRRVELQRRGVRLRIRGLGRPLDEARARRIAEALLAPGEQLLDRLIDAPSDLSDRSYTFLVWPHVVSHTRALLGESPHVA
jgi:hypothetical protein